MPDTNARDESPLPTHLTAQLRNQKWLHALEHPYRREILRSLRFAPAMSARRIVDAGIVPAPVSVVAYHAGVLVSSGLVWAEVMAPHGGSEVRCFRSLIDEEGLVPTILAAMLPIDRALRKSETP